FDIQDVGVRYYTYISSMHYMMEAAAEAGLPFMVLDRPNPNGDYVDGPMLEPEFRSFVGMHEIPLVHGLTVGELAHMIIGEGWLNTDKTLSLTVIPMQ
ncbi:exo-beta-N-acetylmuramidase NamZ domain-containing protein, partial [Bowmanella dokdonensis]